MFRHGTEVLTTKPTTSPSKHPRLEQVFCTDSHHDGLMINSEQLVPVRWTASCMAMEVGRAAHYNTLPLRSAHEIITIAVLWHDAMWALWLS